MNKQSVTLQATSIRENLVGGGDSMLREHQGVCCAESV